MHKRKLFPGFLTNKTGIAIGNELVLIKPLVIFSSIFFQNLELSLKH